jgi:prepilin-type N-terminal cleavage/methylation domain-containing protein
MNPRGLTLIEVLLAIAIIGGLIAVTASVFPSMRNRRALEASTRQLASLLEEARSLTLSAKDASVYGVHFDSTQAVLFVGSSYNAGSATNIVTTLHPLTAIRNITLGGGGSNVVFTRLTGETPNNGSVEVYLVNNSTTARAITISTSGVIGGDL